MSCFFSSSLRSLPAGTLEQQPDGLSRTLVPSTSKLLDQRTSILQSVDHLGVQHVHDLRAPQGPRPATMLDALTCEDEVAAERFLVGQPMVCAEALSFCSTCYKYLSARAPPPPSPRSAFNNVHLEVPPAVEQLRDMTDMEERLCSVHLPFGWIKPLPRAGQLGITGGVVHVPANVNSTTEALPRNLNPMHTILVHLERKLDARHPLLKRPVVAVRVMTVMRVLRGLLVYMHHEGLYGKAAS